MLRQMMPIRPKQQAVFIGAVMVTLLGVVILFFLSAENDVPTLPAIHPQLSSSTPPLPEIYKSLLPDLQIPSSLRQHHPLLSARLHAFLSRPIRSRDSATLINEIHCPRVLSDRLATPYQQKDYAEWWSDHVTEETVTRKRVEMVMYLVDLVKRGEQVVWDSRGGSVEHTSDSKTRQTTPIVHDDDDDDDAQETANRSTYPASPPTVSRGIVTAAGNGDTLQRLLTQLRIMRKHYKIDLPVEVWTYPGEISTSSSSLTRTRNRDYLELTQQLGPTVVRVAHGLTKNWWSTWWWSRWTSIKNYQIKGHAMAHSSFQEILWLDSDNIPLRDPTHLFDSQVYAKGGQRAAFWPDLSKDHVDNAVWRVIGEECDLRDWSFETGQMVVDKAGNNGLNLAALHLAAYMQADHAFWFNMCAGDKDTFRWAFKALGLPFAVAPMWAVPLGFINEKENGAGRFCGHSILQYDLDTAPGDQEPRPLFMHSNLLKQTFGLGRGRTFTHLKRMTNHSYGELGLNYVHQWVYDGKGRGLCTDLEIWNSEPRLPRDMAEHQRVELHQLSDLPDFAGFEDMFYDQGGRAGIWGTLPRS